MIYEARLLKGPGLADAENPQRFLKPWLNVLKKKKNQQIELFKNIRSYSRSIRQLTPITNS